MEFSVTFKGMAPTNEQPDLSVTPAELRRLLEQGLVRIQAEKIRNVLLEDLVKYHSPRVDRGVASENR